MIRLFAALAIPDEIADFITPLQSGVRGARWRPRDSLHITLRFVGDVCETQAADLATELSIVGGGAFALTLAGVGAFDDGRESRSLWAGIDPSEPLSLLARRCDVAARRAALPRRVRRWRAHVTLAYLRDAEPVDVARWIQANNLMRSGAFTVSSFGLYSSRRAAGGSAYRLERLYRLD